MRSCWGWAVSASLCGREDSAYAEAQSAPGDAAAIVRAIRESGKSIYDLPTSGDAHLWLPNRQLENLLSDRLRGMSLVGLPLKTRSRAVREAVCKALGYPVPPAFRRTRPRFPAQNLDVYVQKANNLQVWNENLDGARRYGLVRVSSNDTVQRVKVIDGRALAAFDRTGALTQKYQARFSLGAELAELASSSDTALVCSLLDERSLQRTFTNSPVAAPSHATLLPIAELHRRLAGLVGHTFEDAGHDQERNRGTGLHRAICHALGYGEYHDDGAFPDVTAQLIEVKLQTSFTIDLGLVSPDCSDPIGLPAIDGTTLRHCDVRYVIFFGETDGATVTLAQLVIVTGQDFFDRFARMEGAVLNKKLQIPLPGNFFE